MSGDSRARVSVIIPARNEEANIERAVRSVASQTGAPLEVIVVDDQSADGTSAILERLRTALPCLRVIRLDSLPEGWTGKSYALETGARAASGDWLLFTDADTEHAPGSLGEMLERAESGGVELLSLSPGQLTPTWWEKAVIPLIYVWLSRRYSFDEVNDPQSKAAAANGQYLLIRRRAYDRIGGHQAVRAEILEDVALAARVKGSGGRILFMPGAKWVETRMYRTFGAMWEGWTKNLYLLSGENPIEILGTLAKTALLDFAPILCLLLLPFVPRLANARTALTVPGYVVFASILVARFASYRQRLRQIGFNRDLAFYYWVGAALMAALLLNSLRVHRWGRHIQWKGRAYSTKGATG